MQLSALSPTQLYIRKWAKQMLLLGRKNLTNKKGWGEALDAWSKSKGKEKNMAHVTIVGPDTYSLLLSKAMDIYWSQMTTRSHT